MPQSKYVNKPLLLHTKLDKAGRLKTFKVVN